MIGTQIGIEWRILELDIKNYKENKLIIRRLKNE